MAAVGSPEMLLAVLLSLLVAMVAGMICVWAWVVRGLITGRPILPEAPLVERSDAPWGARTVLLTILLYLAVNLSIEQGYALATGRLPAKSPPVSAPDHTARETPKNPLAAPSEPTVTEQPPTALVRGDAPGSRAAGNPAGTSEKERLRAVAPNSPRPDDEIFNQTETMTLLGISDVVLLILLPLLVRLTSGARLRDIGLSWKGWERQVGVGVYAALCAAPVVYAVQFASLQIWRLREHPVHRMVKDEFSLGVADLAILSAVVVAPIFEELMFRGVLQSWLARTLRRSAGVGHPSSPVPAALVNGAASPAIAKNGYSELALRDAPSRDLLPNQILSENARPLRKSREPGLWAIILTSLIFGALHSRQWPAPVALFVLALVIGTVYHRTGSMIAAICMHASFNAFSTTAMFVSVLFGAGVEAPKPPAARIESVASTRFVNSISHLNSRVGRSW
jgi:membrane protease YdiL (CAAX protease family)